MEFIILPEEKQNSTLREDTSSDLSDKTKREAKSSDSQRETEVSDSCDVMPPDRSFCHHAPGRPRILRTGKRGHPRKKYGLVSIIIDSFETNPSVQDALAGPNKIAWKNPMKEKHDALIKENAWTLVSRLKHKKPVGCEYATRLPLEATMLIADNNTELVILEYVRDGYARQQI
ncbi:hypothetical protein NPIL_211591 [Nephila pilipes]|uniref:Uncharacterized protein n=1 Tax=Nephila pilipes TaxID=299642 RepID=A0A8X6MHM1_NEPPI|nr:hypothetical protein NPIL_211591 [Nephila pilipes]